MNQPKETNSIRCFFAVLLDENTRLSLHQLALQIKKQDPHKSIRWVSEENYHLTLRFMGNVKVESIPSLLTQVKKSLNNFSAFSIAVHSPELFPKHHPHVISLKIEPEDKLLQLAQAIEQAVVSEGFLPETRGFKAHLTIARLKTFNRNLKLDSFSIHVNTSVNEVAFVQSQLNEKGSVYTVLETIPLSLN